MNRYKTQIDYTYNIEDGSSVTSSVYYLIDAEDEQSAITSMQEHISNNNTERNMLYNGKKYSVLTNIGVAVSAVIE